MEKKPVVDKPKQVVSKQEVKESASPDADKKETVQAKKEETSPSDSGTIKTEYRKLEGPKLTGAKIDLKQFERPKKEETCEYTS